MAPLKVIGAGYGRTGTDSLRTALNILGFNCFHMRSVMMDNVDRHPEVFTDAFLHPEKPVDWDMLYEGFDAAVDWPTVSFVDRLMKHYPDAKIVLTDRDADSWYRSVKSTLFSLVSEGRRDYDSMSEYMKRVRKMGEVLILDGALYDPEKFNDEEAIKAMFNAHVEWVKKNVPSDRLFIMQLGEGWERLCKFLDVPVPDVPYPSANSSKSFQDEFLNGKLKETILKEQPKDAQSA
ncbi:hypothetical protein O0I10_009142 [Lichtheimia ornata]|uniref:P-loop containing nucleoside triphosphate hydrolase protein n=1 Tax=Lichtheimia ornata TaxID=688661 RepID=A0AAD7UX74_9FUNG|nr:uncharacterized protein O0I10_009142 [Lichtheimia ornata]KAJ8655107.1 hypothetical protein O0I10_009142 [Lichtheimia ornata]